MKFQVSFLSIMTLNGTIQFPNPSHQTSRVIWWPFGVLHNTPATQFCHWPASSKRTKKHGEGNSRMNFRL